MWSWLFWSTSVNLCGTSSTNYVHCSLYLPLTNFWHVVRVVLDSKSVLADAIFYVVSENGTLIVNEGFEAELRKLDIGAEDFAFVPVWAEYQVLSAQDVIDLVRVVIHGGPQPVGATLVD